LRKTKYIAILILSFIFSNCRTKKEIAIQKKEYEFEKYVEYISKDTLFNQKIKTYYSDFSNCENLNFNLSKYIKPISTKDFPIGALSKTIMLNGIKNFESLKASEKSEKFDSIYKFSEYYSEKISNQNWRKGCGIKLTFAEKINGILPLKFELIDKDIDPRINYQPRKGIYILEFNNENEIIDRDYIIFSN